MNPRPVLVVGSANLDMVFQCPEFPRPGETLLGGEFATHPGGKGANQAVAIGKLGGNVHFCGAVGTDPFGNVLTESLQSSGVQTDHLHQSPDHPSGTACILVNKEGGNIIVVAPGANFALTPQNVTDAIKDTAPEYVLAQLEVPLPAIQAAAESAPRFILNPAPATPLPPEILHRCWLLTPNETELETLTGIAPATIEETERAARSLLDQGVQNVIVTLGSRGAAWVSDQGTKHFPAHPVTPVDTTAAGDAFNGALVHFLNLGHSLEEAIPFANAYAALSTTRPGAQEAMPTQSEWTSFIKS